jgi:hypothetical protein
VLLVQRPCLPPSGESKVNVPISCGSDILGTESSKGARVTVKGILSCNKRASTDTSTRGIENSHSFVLCASCKFSYYRDSLAQTKKKTGTFICGGSGSGSGGP